MFEAIRNNQRIVQIVLAIIILPFAFFGVRSYTNGNEGAADDVAKVGKQSISKAEFDDALRNFKRNNQIDAETPKQRIDLLNALIDRKVLLQAVQESRLFVPDELVVQQIRSNPAFQTGGQFSADQYKMVLNTNGLSSERYESDVRTDLAVQKLLEPISKTELIASSSVKRILALEDEERTVSSLILDAKSFEANVKLAPDAVQKFYDANQSLFQRPERIKAEYVVLSIDDVAKQLKQNDAELKEWYDKHLAQFTEPEERRASHILITVDSNASKEQKDQARKRAEEVLDKVKANPAEFAKIAQAESKDTMSAGKGGDLGFFRQDAMVGPFADAVFAMKPNQISDVVETSFGYHIIQLNSIHPSTVKPFDSVRLEVAGQAGKEVATKRFSEMTNEFGNLVYEKATTFEPVKEKLGLAITSSDWIEKAQPPSGVLGNKKFLAALFSVSSIKNRQNTEAVSLGDGLLASGRIVDYQPASVRPLDDVRVQIEQKLQIDEAVKLATQDGEAKLAKLKAGEALIGKWSEAKSIKRVTPGLDPATIKAVFGAKVDKTPIYTGVATVGGYSLYRIDKVQSAEVKDDDSRVTSYSDGVSLMQANQDMRSFVDGLRQRFAVKILVDVSQAKTDE